MKTRSLLLIFLLFSCVIASSANDICTFVNLGFSPDSRNFMFGIYGVHSKDNLPYSEAYLVDVKANRFLPGGQLASTGQKPATLGQDGSGALFNILHTIKPQIDSYKIDHLELGRLVYILVNGQDAKPNISFRDFNTDTQYDLLLNQKSRPVSDKTGSVVSSESEFSINLTITPKTGKSATLTVGKASYYRDSVDAYLIRQVLLSPDESSLIFVIEKQDRSKGSLQVGYMVETVSLK